VESKEYINPLKDIGSIVIVTLFFGVAAYIFHLPYVREEAFDILKWHTFSRDFGVSGILVFGCALAFANACGFPRVWICAIAGALHGAYLGTLVSQIATLIGAALNFFVAKWLLRGPIKRRLTGRFKIWYDRFGDNGFYWVLYIRLFPLGNATITNLISGASRMRFLDFLTATFLGYLPLTIIFALFGSSASQNKPVHLAVGFAFFMAFVAGQWIYRKYYMKREEPTS
jgi:uncharacterized membrane protein YdjX (TVP38/TMEM64 family)